MGLDTYRRKRNFQRTPEPHGDGARAVGRAFVVQKHAATRLHYDFRLELDGVLKSWAVPKGPSLDPADKRLAVHVEDHPIEYGDFEGVIPRDEYGGGTVMLWDTGTWEPLGDPNADYRRGRLKFRLDGSKLHGGWMLVRTGKPSTGEKEQWLLFKEKDEFARPGEGQAILDREDRSVASGRSMAEIARRRERVWSSRSGEVETPPSARSIDASAIPGARKAALKETPPPLLATLVKEAPTGDDWVHEIKFDGYRVLCRFRDGRASLVTRNGNDWTDRFGDLVPALESLGLANALLDGEVVVMLPNGTTSFQALQKALGAGHDAPLLYYAFDLLYLESHDLRGAALVDRKDALARLLEPVAADELVRYSDHVRGNGQAFLEQACGLGLEGIISKRADSLYTSGRSRDWLKVKCSRRESFVIGGYTDPKGSRSGIGALLVGAYAGDRLRYHGKVGTGFTADTLRDLERRLAPLQRSTPPFDPPPSRADARAAHWVEPRLVAEVTFTELTADGILRHPSFQGLREDIQPTEAVLPAPADAPKGRTGGDATPPRAFAGEPITSPEKVLYPDVDVTKLDLMHYYQTVADLMLPHVSHRPLTLVRCPDGFTGSCFFQKHGGEGMPSSIARIQVNDDDAEPYMYVDSLRGVIALVQMNVLELHGWNSRTDRLERPDQIVFDLDPGPDVSWERVVEAALLLRIRLQELDLATFVKTTGGRGLHVVVPLIRRHDWEFVREFTQTIALSFAREAPDRFTARVAKAHRKGRIYIDYLRNARDATAILPYSTRSRPGAPVAAPVTWEELVAGTSPEEFTVRTMPERVRMLREDPWQDFAQARATIKAAAIRRLGID